MPDLESELDRLYGLPLAEFTAARNDLAAQLRRDASRDEAEGVKALAKPSVAAWAVNQLARERRSDISALLDAGAALRKSQGSALGGGGGEALRKAARHHSERVRALAEAARELLAAEGRKPADSTIERVAQTLRSASVDEEGRRLLAHGRLSAEPEAAGFEALAALPRSGKRASGSKRGEPPKRQSAEERRRIRQLEAETKRLGKDADEAEREAARAGREAERARERAEAARTKADRAKEKADSEAAHLRGA
jgi:hypothetical protein